MNMMNKCAKFHKDSPSSKKLNSISRERLNFRRRPFLCTTLYRNLMQASSFCGTFDQFFLCIFLWKFHRTCLSTFSIPWCKKVKNDQKLKSRGTGPALILSLITVILEIFVSKQFSHCFWNLWTLRPAGSDPRVGDGLVWNPIPRVFKYTFLDRMQRS